MTGSAGRNVSVQPSRLQTTSEDGPAEEKREVSLEFAQELCWHE